MTQGDGSNGARDRCDPANAESRRAENLPNTQAGVTAATFEAISGAYAGDRVSVHFNPETLEYSIKNTLKEGGNGNEKKKQYVGQTTANLKLELVFDTTNTRTDVTRHTWKIARYMEPSGGSKLQSMPPVVEFRWNEFCFRGMFESYSENLEFFDSQGIPLRATVSLELAQQDCVFPREKQGTPSSAQAPPPTALSLAGSPTAAADDAGDPGAARDVAEANGAESLRFSEAPALFLSDEVELSGPAGFAAGGASASLGFGAGASLGFSASAGAGLSAGAGFSAAAGAGLSIGAAAGLGAGASAGISAGISAGVSAEFSAGISASAGASAGLSAAAGASATAGAAFGFSATGSASAGVAASEGAFSLLSTPAARARSASFDASSLLAAGADVEAAVSDDAGFTLTGRAIAAPSGGAGASAQARLSFD